MRTHLLHAALLTLVACLLMGACPQRIDADGDGVFSDTDCDDADPFTFPGAPTDFCDGKDNDCDGTIDEDTTAVTVFADQDRDGAGDPDISAQGCVFPGGPYAANGDDCDDTNGQNFPGNNERCDQADNDCDGDVDEYDGPPLYNQNQDGDPVPGGAPIDDVCDVPSAVPALPGGIDCDDLNASVYPGHPETCDGVDNDCDPATTVTGEDTDADGDGALACADCDDANAGAFPGAIEACDGVDNDCNGQVDDGAPGVPAARDADGDGYGDMTATQFNLCLVPAGFSTQITDCDDSNPLVHPGVATDVCDTRDNDCDGSVDEDQPPQQRWYDSDGDGYGAGTAVMTCNSGPPWAVSDGDCNDTNSAISPIASELCNGVDDDCDGTVDNGLTFSLWYVDLDNDGYGDPNTLPTSSCLPIPGRVQDNTDCDDTTVLANPGITTDVCDSVDNDCDAQVDEDATFSTWYQDLDGDGYGFTGAVGVTTCLGAGVGFLVPQSTNNTDCNDSNPAVNPAATEVCDGVDNNCDGQVNESLPVVDYYWDVDGDGYGALNGNAYSTCDLASQPVPGVVTDNTDCDDTNAGINPGATEVCGNGVDDDCNGQIDDGGATPSVWYVDTDGDGYGDPNTLPTLSCTPVTGRVQNNTDCDDSDASISPAVTADLCDLADNDCDGSVDEDQPSQTRYLDGDGDGYGVTGAAIQTCNLTGPPWVVSDGDCDDGNATIWPGAPELCNSIDDDCDGQADEGFVKVTATPDTDGDGYGDLTATQFLFCALPSGFSAQISDCDDTNAAINPGAGEVCDAVDNDCDGQLNEGLPSLSLYPDGDGDGWGNGGPTPLTYCGALPGFTTDNTDCDDTNAAVNPGVPVDLCDSVDNDCDFVVDEDATQSVYYPDFDNDGFGGNNPVYSSCYPLNLPTVIEDCDDYDAAVNPNASEVCGNGVDDDCDTQIDEGCSGGGGPTSACGPINTDTTWSGSVEMTCTVDVVGGATLTVAPGTTVSAHNNAELTVGVHGAGSIDVAGTVGSPVVFTSVATSPAPGDWGGLFVGAQSGSSSLSNLTVSYGGALGTCIFLVDLPTTMTVTNVAVDFCGGPSGWIIGNSDVDLLGAVAANNTGEGMLITQDSTVGTLSGLVLTGNAGRPGTMPLTVASLLEPGFTLSGNGDDRVEVTGGVIDAQISIPDVGLPYLLMTDVFVESATPGAAVLTLESGVIIEVGQPVGIYTGQAGFGTLDASAGGITLTSGSSSPAPGDWLGVDLGASDEGSVFDGLSISYGGGNGFGNVRVDTSDAAFVSGSSEFSAAYGIYRANGALPDIQPAWTYASNASGDLF